MFLNETVVRSVIFEKNERSLWYKPNT